MKIDLFQPRVADNAGQQPRCLQHELKLELHCFVTGGGQVQLSGVVGGCIDAWVSEELLVLLHAGPGAGAELQAWVPLWAQAVLEVEHRPSSDETQAGLLLLLPCACAYVSPQPPFYWPLAPRLRACRLELGAEHTLLLDATGQVFSWGTGRHGQLDHGTLEAEPKPRLLEALQGLPMAEGHTENLLFSPKRNGNPLKGLEQSSEGWHHGGIRGRI